MATHYKGTEQEVRALNTYIKLSRAAQSSAARIHRHLAETGITQGQFGVLDAIYFLGPLAQRDLAKKHLMSPGNMTMVVDNLERRGLVRRERQAYDRRRVRVHLTEEGRRLFEQVFPRHAAGIQRVMSALSKAEQDALAGLCRKLGTAQEK